jgi:hypothetical protein
MPADVRCLAKHAPALFLQRYSPPVLIDEIQYATELLPVDEKNWYVPVWLI